MNVIKIVIAAVAILTFSSCATTKYKSFSTPAKFKTAGNLVKGKTPKEAAQIIGQPMSAYYKSDKSVYYMVYPLADSDISMTDLMFNDRLECLALNFEKEKGYKFDGWQSDVGFTCSAIKGEQLDLTPLQ